MQPDFVIALDDVEAILNADETKVSLPARIRWITVDPGRQYVGSFNPVDKNFYEDAYAQSLSKKKARKPFPRMVWSMKSGDEWTRYSDKDNKRLTRAFFEGRIGCLVIDRQFYVDFRAMRHVCLAEPLSRCEVKMEDVGKSGTAVAVGNSIIGSRMGGFSYYPPVDEEESLYSDEDYDGYFGYDDEFYDEEEEEDYDESDEEESDDDEDEDEY